MIHVYFTDGTVEHYNSLGEAEEGVSETVFGTDFATTVEQIVDDSDRVIRCVFSLKLEEDE